MSVAQLIVTTSCCLCGEDLGVAEEIADSILSVDTDYVRFSHASCVTKLPLHLWSDWHFPGDDDL